MSSARMVFSLLFIINLCPSCTGFSIDGTEATSITLNATERLVVATNHAGTDRHSFAVCAEPSPDALGGVEFLNALKVKGPGGNSNLELETAYKETLAELGKRTSTIQLLRDALYRACEAHLNGMLAKEQYRELLYGYDDLVLTLLAIEGITQTHATDHLTREMEEKSEAPNRSPKNNISLEKVNSHSTENQTTNEIAKEIRLILTSYYDFQKFIYENCHVESYRCREIRNSITKSPNYSQETRNSPP